jgi:MFS family permease
MWSVGVWFTNLGAALLLYRQTHSPFMLGVLGAAQFGPQLALAPWAGRLADRYDERRVLLVTQPAAVALNLLFGCMALAEVANAPSVITLALALGVANAFSLPSQLALPRSLAAREDIATATALNSMTFSIARVVGPLGAAAVIAAFGIATAFFVAALAHLLFMGAVAILRPRSRQRSEHVRLRDSLRLLRTNPRLAALLVIIAALSLASDPLQTQAPAFARAFGHPDTWAGIIIGAFGAGAVATALVFGERRGSPRQTIAAMAMFGSAVIVYSLSPSMWVALPFLFVAGVGYLSVNARVTTQLQLGVDEGHQGRIMALWAVAFVGVRPFASLSAGAIADVVSVRLAGVVLALPLIVVAALLWRRLSPERLRGSR